MAAVMIEVVVEEKEEEEEEEEEEDELPPGARHARVWPGSVAVLPALRCRAVGVRQQRRVQEGESVAHRRRRRQNHRRRDHGESFGARSWPFPPYDHGRYTSRGLMPGQIEVVWCEFSSLDSDGSTHSAVRCTCTRSYFICEI